MPSYNSITIVGNCGNDPEMRYTPSGKPVTQINVAVDAGRYVDHVWKEDTQWYRVSCFNELAEKVNERIIKGEPVMCVGKLSVRRWTDENTGQQRYSLEILANKVLNFRKSAKAEVKPDVPDVPTDGDIETDELPF